MVWILFALIFVVGVVVGGGNSAGSTNPSRSFVEGPVSEVLAAVQSQPPSDPMLLDDDGIFESGDVSPTQQHASITPASLPSASSRVARRRTMQQDKSQLSQRQSFFPKVLTPHHVFKPAPGSGVDNKKLQSKSLKLSHMFKKFKFKGYGLSFVKSISTWSQVGLGVRIPITPNFPDYDCHTALPRIGAMSGLYWELDSGFFFRHSISFSFPLQVAIFFAAVMANLVGFVPDALAARIRNRKATDSIRRVGFTVSLRHIPMGPQKGTQGQVGPWFFYVPGLRFMSRILPFIFFFPALIMALLNLFMDLDAESARFIPPTLSEQVEPQTHNQTSQSPLPSSSLSQPLDPEGRVVHLTARSSATNVDTGNINININNRIGKKNNVKASAARRGYGVRYWHSAWLSWCATKTAGVGFNTGENFSVKKDKFDASTGISVLFDIAPFFPFGPGLALPALSGPIKGMWEALLNVGLGLQGWDPLKLRDPAETERNTFGGDVEEREDEEDDDQEQLLRTSRSKSKTKTKKTRFANA